MSDAFDLIFSYTEYFPVIFASKISTVQQLTDVSRNAIKSCIGVRLLELGNLDTKDSRICRVSDKEIRTFAIYHFCERSATVDHIENVSLGVFLDVSDLLSGRRTYKLC
jgi:hypothetical protein